MKLTTVDRLTTAAVTAAAMLILAALLGPASGEERNAEERDSPRVAPPTPEEVVRERLRRDPDRPSGPLAEMALEEVINEAMENNPDIVLAKARLHEAEAELRRARLQVAREVSALYHRWKGIGPERIVEARHQLMLTRTPRPDLSAEEQSLARRQAEVELMARRAEQDELEAELRYLLGWMPAGAAEEDQR